jgi:putative sigma-54 modulation protein
MQTSVTFKNIDTSDHLTNYISSKLNRFDKLLDNPASANVVLRVEKFRHIAEVNIYGDRLNIVGKEETEDMYSAIDKVLDKIDIQIKKNREKIRQRKGGRKGGIEFNPPDVERFETEQAPQVLVETIDYKPMDIEEATMQLELDNNHFLVFTNARTEKINVLYRRKDGNLGLIQPNS